MTTFVAVGSYGSHKVVGAAPNSLGKKSIKQEIDSKISGMISGFGNIFSGIRGGVASSVDIKTTEEKLIESNVIFAKEVYARSAYISQEWREKLCLQYGSLVDPEEWDSRDVVPTKESIVTFLRALVFLEPCRRPGMGATSAGNLVATWKQGEWGISLECRSNDVVKWTIITSPALPGVGTGIARTVDLPKIYSTCGIKGLFKNEE